MTVEKEQVRPYEHPTDGATDEHLHKFRSKQLHLRSQEVAATLDLLEKLNSGQDLPTNLWRALRNVDFRGKIDHGHQAVIMGHSFGAATAFFAASCDNRFGSVVGMDPWMFPLPSAFKVTQQLPTLIINSESFHWAANMSALKEYIRNNPKSLMVTLNGTGHMDQSDFTVAFPTVVTARFRPSQTRNPQAVLRANNDIILAFLKEKVGMVLPDVHTTLPTRSSEGLAFEKTHDCIIDQM